MSLKIIFDQYSRYRACADLIKQLGVVSKHSILDVGSGPECLIRQFLPGYKMTFVDPLIPPNSGDQYIVGNIFSSHLDGRCFECVTAVDVLEHVPPEFRSQFLDRMSALSCNALILGFPALEGGVASAADKSIEDNYRYVYERDYSWLEEHNKYGLPSLDETVEHLAALGWHCQTVGHGHVPWLKELLSFIICAWEVPEFSSIVMEASEKFNHELYHFDFLPPHYRQFVVASRTPLPTIVIPSGSVGKEGAESLFRNILDETWRQYFAVSLRLLSERNSLVVEQDKLVAERDGAVAERDKAVSRANVMQQSVSWRMTRPLRFAAQMFRYGPKRVHQQRIAQALRRLYHQLPLPTQIKRLISSLYHSVFIKTIRTLRRKFINVVQFHAPTIKPAANESSKPDYIVWGVIDWNFRHQRPQQIAISLASTGRRVFYISPIFIDDERAGFEVEALDQAGLIFQVKLFVKGAPDIYSSAPKVDAIAKLKSSIGEVLEWANTKHIISVVDHPFWSEVAAMLPNSRLVYDCMDHHEGFDNNAESLMRLEKQLLSDAELTITTSAWLDDAIAPFAKHRVLIRNAGEYEHFAKVPESIYRDPQGRRVIGYYGAIAEWFDQDLVEAVALQNPDCSLLLIGADTVNLKSKLAKLHNVTFTGEVPYSELPYYLHGLDVCLLPFKVMPLTLATNPVKAYEYLGAGKPIVTVALPEMVQFDGLVYVADSKEAFLKAISGVLRQPEPVSLIQRRKDFAAGQTWRHRAEALIQYAESATRDVKVSVIVVTYNNLELTRACLESLDEYSQYEPLEIIVVDNASSDESPAFLSEWVANGQNRLLILNEDNKGFAAANNQGLAIASGEFLVLLNNDTYVTPGWIRTLVRHLQRDKGIGLIGPVTNNIGNEAKIDITYDSMEEMLHKSAAYTRRHIGQTYPLKTAAFFCVMLPRSIYERVGALDEAFGLGFFEDDDYCRRVEKLGLRVVCAEDVFIHHQLSASFNKLKQQDRLKLFEDNKKVYEAKWGEWVPHKHRSMMPKKCSPEVISDVFYGHKYFAGHCVVCGKQSRFFYQDVTLWRESLNCQHCRSTSRYRSIARGLLRAINELNGLEASSLSTLPRSSNSRLRAYDTQPPFYYDPCAYPLPDLLKGTGWIDVELSNYKPNKQMGAVLAKGITNQNLESLTFSDESLDIVITSDVMEHVRLDDQAHREIYRVLKPGGIYIFTVPHDRSWEKTLTRVQVNEPDDPSKDVHLLEPEYHGDTNSDGDGGVLAYRTYGRDIEEYLTKLGFEVDYCREDMADLGILNTELYYCRKIAC